MRDADAALDYLLTWCESLGGEPLDGIDWEEHTDHAGRVTVLAVRPFRVSFEVGTILTVAMDMDAHLRASFYRFDLRRGGELLFRHDCHPGHEELGNGPYHLHLGPAEDDRRADDAQTLETIFELVTAENQRRSPESPR